MFNQLLNQFFKPTNFREATCSRSSWRWCPSFWPDKRSTKTSLTKASCWRVTTSSSSARERRAPSWPPDCPKIRTSLFFFSRPATSATFSTTCPPCIRCWWAPTRTGTTPPRDSKEFVAPPTAFVLTTEARSSAAAVLLMVRYLVLVSYLF